MKALVVPQGDNLWSVWIGRRQVVRDESYTVAFNIADVYNFPENYEWDIGDCAEIARQIRKLTPKEVLS